MPVIEVRDRKKRIKLRELGFGMENGDTTILNDLEAEYLSERKIEKFETSVDRNSPRYKVFAYLRDRGYISRPSEDNDKILRIYKKGFRPGEDRTAFVALCISEYPESKDIKEILEIGRKMRKTPIVAICSKNNIEFLKISKTRFD